MGGRPLGERDRFPFFDEFGGSHDPAIAGNSDRKNSLVGTPPIPPQTRPVDTLCIQQRGEIAVIESSPRVRQLLDKEQQWGVGTLAGYRGFADRAARVEGELADVIGNMPLVRTFGAIRREHSRFDLRRADNRLA